MARLVQLYTGVGQRRTETKGQETMTSYEVVGEWDDTLKSGSYEGEDFQSFAIDILTSFPGAISIVWCFKGEIGTITLEEVAP